MANEAVSEKDTVLYRIGQGFAWLLVHLIMPVRYHGKEKLQNRQGPYVLISNHRHALDPIGLAGAESVRLSREEGTGEISFPQKMSD